MVRETYPCVDDHTLVDGPQMGHFSRLDFFDCMILTDLFCFFATLIFIFLYLFACLFATENMKEMLLLDPFWIADKDFLESEVFFRNLTIQMFSFALVCVTWIGLLYRDDI